MRIEFFHHKSSYHAAVSPHTGIFPRGSVKFYLGYYNRYECDSNGKMIAILNENSFLLSQFILSHSCYPRAGIFPRGSVKFYLGYYNRYECDSNGKMMAMLNENSFLLSQFILSRSRFPPHGHFPPRERKILSRLL